MNDMREMRTVSAATIEALCTFDSPTVSNAIERFKLRTRNEGFVNGSVRCLFPELPPRVGYAATARVRASSTPVNGGYYFDRLDWWSYVASIPEPRFVVLRDADHMPGLGALVGEIHAHICTALNCTAVLTNGAVRDLLGVKATGLQLFAGNVAVSHAYAHVVDFGETVEVGGLHVRSGSLLHGDVNGVVSIPLEIAAEVPGVAAEMLASERELIAYCDSRDFSLAGLSERIASVTHRLAHPEKSGSL